MERKQEEAAQKAEGKPPMDSNPYKKFVVYAAKESTTHSGSRVTMTGLDLTLEYAKEKLEDGYTVQIQPYTQEEWVAKGN